MVGGFVPIFVGESMSFILSAKKWEENFGLGLYKHRAPGEEAVASVVASVHAHKGLPTS